MDTSWIFKRQNCILYKYLLFWLIPIKKCKKNPLRTQEKAVCFPVCFLWEAQLTSVSSGLHNILIAAYLSKLRHSQKHLSKHLHWSEFKCVCVRGSGCVTHTHTHNSWSAHFHPRAVEYHVSSITDESHKSTQVMHSTSDLSMKSFALKWVEARHYRYHQLINQKVFFVRDAPIYRKIIGSLKTADTQGRYIPSINRWPENALNLSFV